MTALADYIVPPPDDSERERRRRREEELLLLLLLIGDDDLQRAKQFWQSHAQPAYRGIVTGEGFTWNPQKQIYVAANGRLINPATLKRISLQVSDEAAHDLAGMTNELNAGAMTAEEWSLAMGRELQSLFLSQAALAAGGFDQLGHGYLSTLIGTAETPPTLAFDIDKLTKYADAIDADPKVARPSRSALYGETGNGAYELIKRESHKDTTDDQGRRLFLYEKSVLGPNENHCYDSGDTDGCVEVAEAGWQPIGTLPAPGLRTCKAACKCELQYSLTGGQFENN